MSVDTQAETQPGTERLSAFSDAVIAIAMTLLILPLTDIDSHGRSVWSILVDNRTAIFGFALSFAVIANYWTVHHGLLRSLRGHDTALIRLNTVWLAAIAFLPFPTSLIERDVHNGFATFYTASLLAVSVLTVGLARHLKCHPELRRPGTSAELRSRVVDSWSAVVALTVALALSLYFPRAGLVALLLLLPAPHVAAAVSARRQGRPRVTGEPAAIGGHAPPSVDTPERSP